MLKMKKADDADVQDFNAATRRTKMAIAEDAAGGAARADKTALKVEADLMAGADLTAEADSEAAVLIEQIGVTRNVYRNYRLSETGEPTGYISNVEREENMKRLLWVN